ncbi:MAG: protein kinase [Polyangiaceae bacterium]|nr:protein kinase [Polyangiaceae bacterium]
MPEVVCPQCEHACESSHKFCPVCGFPIAEVHGQLDDPLLGTTLPGGYTILELVGVGGMGRVYRAEQKVLGRTVAVKIVHPHLLGDENASARFITEARAASRLNHPNSVGVIDFGRNGGQLYLVMEFLRGRDLARVTYEDGLLAFPRIVDILVQVMAALAEAHHLEIIHRDLKPENIVLEPMRSGGDFVKVVDFGLAKMRELNTNITSPGLVCGTPDYMAPEQGRGDPIDARSDLYACGVILYQLLTGRLPFEAESPTQVVLMHLSQPPPDPTKIAPERNIPAPLVEVCMRALSKNPAARYQNADEFAAALKTTLASLGRSGKERDAAWAGAEPGTHCPSCNALVPLGQKFCGDCGTRISSPRGRGQADALATGNELRHIPRLPLPFTAREEDLDWLDLCRFEVGSWVTTARVVGDHGVGKTRLLRQFLLQASDSGDLVVQAGPDPWSADVGYWSLRSAIVGLAGLPTDGGSPSDWTSATPEARRGLEEIFAKSGARAEALSPAWETGNGIMSHSDRRFIAAEALRWAMARAARAAQKNRVILAIEDLHALDGASKNALVDVIQEPPLVGMLLVGTHPPDYDPGWGGPERRLGGLPLNVAQSLAKGIAPTAATSSNDGKTVSPMYVEQLVRFTMEGGKSPPARLGDLVAMRLERLQTDARRILQGVAVLGDDTDPGQLLSIVQAADPDGAIEELRSAGMIEVTDRRISSSHPLIRDVVLGTIPAGVKRELHERAAADQSAATRELPLEVLALHSYHAQNSFEALMLLETIANRAGARGDLNGCVIALRRALELARRELFRGDIDDPVRAVLIFSRKLGEALARAGNYADANGVLLEALDLAGPSGPDRVQVLGALAFTAKERTRPDEARRYLREAIHLAKEELLVDLVDSLEHARREWAMH